MSNYCDLLQHFLNGKMFIGLPKTYCISSYFMISIKYSITWKWKRQNVRDLSPDVKATILIFGQSYRLGAKEGETWRVPAPFGANPPDPQPAKETLILLGVDFLLIELLVGDSSPPDPSPALDKVPLLRDFRFLIVHYLLVADFYVISDFDLKSTRPSTCKRDIGNW